MRSTRGSAFVFLHGLGDQGSSWRHLEGKVTGVSKWLFPNAPNVPVTVNGGARCPSWFDMDEIPVVATSSDKVADVKASVVKVHAMLKGLEAEGFASESIYVGGFSQGGAIALLACLTYPRKLGGAAVLSGWLMLRDELLAADSGLASPANASGLRVFWGHGEADGVVTYPLQALGVAQLRMMGADVTAASYPGMAHTACLREFSDLNAWTSVSIAAAAASAAAESTPTTEAVTATAAAGGDENEIDEKIEEMYFAPGSRVKLRGLRKAPAMNGRMATVVRRVPASGRIEVKIPSELDPSNRRAPITWRRCALRAENLELIPCATDGEELPDDLLGAKLVTCPLCGEKMEMASEEQCAAHMSECVAFKKLYPGGEQGFSGPEQADAMLKELGL